MFRFSRPVSFFLVVCISVSLSAYSRLDALRDLCGDYTRLEEILSQADNKKLDYFVAALEYALADSIINKRETGIPDHHTNLVFFYCPDTGGRLIKVACLHITKIMKEHLRTLLNAHPYSVPLFTEAAVKNYKDMNIDVLRLIEEYDIYAKEQFTQERRKQPARDVFCKLAGKLPEDVIETIEFMRGADKFRRMGAKIPRGILLIGPPGTGKTAIARAIAQEVGAAFFKASGSEFVNQYVGVGPANVRKLFERAREGAQEYGLAIIFIDEIDAVGATRSGAADGGNKEYDNTVNELLVQMDGVDQDLNIYVFGATNHLARLDPALLRPGRFDRIISIDMPDKADRGAILAFYAKQLPFVDKIDYAAIAKSTEGLSGADLEQLVNEATIFAVRDNADKVEQWHFDQARKKMLARIRKIKREKQRRGRR